MSKALEALEDIILYLNANEPKGLYCENIETIQQALINAEKEHKALEILKKTKNIKVSFYQNGSGKHYKIEFDRTRNQTITKEEFELLEEVL